MKQSLQRPEGRLLRDNSLLVDRNADPVETALLIIIIRERGLSLFCGYDSAAGSR